MIDANEEIGWALPQGFQDHMKVSQRIKLDEERHLTEENEFYEDSFEQRKLNMIDDTSEPNLTEVTEIMRQKLREGRGAQRQAKADEHNGDLVPTNPSQATMPNFALTEETNPSIFENKKQQEPPITPTIIKRVK